MTLGNPIGLIGLLSLPVILALHLLFKRQRRYVVSHLGLWSFLETQARGPRARRIPITWILLLDLLIGTLLSLAWAQPRITFTPPVQPPKHLVILLDVSSSMRAQDGTQAGFASRFDQAKADVATLLKGIGPRDVVTILGFGMHASTIADSRQDGSRAQLADAVDAAQAGETGSDSAFQEALALGEASLSKDTSLPAEFHIVTDGDFSLDSDSQGALGKFAYPLHWHLVGDTADNQAVIELNTTPTDSSHIQVFARIANFANRTVSREVLLQVDGNPVNNAVVELPANSSIARVWQVASPVNGTDTGATGKTGSVVVTLRGTDALPEDDSAAIGLQPEGSARVALVTENQGNGPDALQQAVQAVPGVDLKVIAPADYDAGALAAEPAPFDLTIFRNTLPKTWPAGEVLVVDPPAGDSGQGAIPATGGAALYAQTEQDIPAGTAAQPAAALDADPLVEGIDFSGVRWARVWRLSSTPPGFVPLLQAGDIPILLESNNPPSTSAPGRVIVMLADLEAGNFTKHPAFPILMANLVAAARRAPLPAAFKTGEAVPLPETGGYRSIEITPPQQATVNLEGAWPSDWSGTLDPGLYRFRFTGTDGKISEFAAGAMAGDALESDLRPRSWTQSLVDGKELSGANGMPKEQPIDLRPWLLGAAVLALVLEATLAWRR